MKRMLCLLLCVCLALPGALAEETANAGVLAELPEESFDLLGVVGDTLYVMSWENAYRAVEGGWERVELPTHENDVAFCTDGLYAFVRDYGEWDEVAQMLIPPEDGAFSIERSKVREDGGFDEPETICKIDWRFTGEESLSCNGFTVADGAAYLLMHDWDAAIDSEKNELWRIDLTTGKGTSIAADYLSGLVPCGDGLLLSRYYNRSEAWHEDGTIDSPEIATINAETGEMTVLGAMANPSCGCLVYDAASGAAYYSDESYVYRFDLASGASERVGRMISSSYRENCKAVVWHDRYYLVDAQADILDVATLDPALLPTRTLRLSSFTMEEQNRGFLREHPDVALEESSQYVVGAPELTQHMASSDAADVYFLSLSAGAFKILRDKGWVLDLSSSQKLTDTIAAMDPRLVKPLTKDGKLYGLPVNVSASMTAYYPQALETFGMSADELPHTYEELLEFIVTWRDNYADDNPDAIFYVMMRNLFEEIFQQIFDMQMNLCEARDERMTFNTPTIQKLLKRLDSNEVKQAIEDVCPVNEGSMEWGSDEIDHTLFTTDYDPMPLEYRWDEDSVPILMRLDDETEPVIPMNMMVMFVNPRSEQQELAVEYMEYMADHLPQTVRIALMPEVNEPIEEVFYQQEAKSAREAVAELEARLEAMRAAGKELDDDPDSPYYDMTKADMEMELDRRHQVLERIEGDRWVFSEEDIAYYRENVEPYLVTVVDSVFKGENNQATSIIRQFVDGSMDAERFIREFDRIVDMMQMEQGL